MESELIKAIQNELQKSGSSYFSYAWREKMEQINSFLEEESRHSKLVVWIEKELELMGEIKDIFCPADKTETTTRREIDTYLKTMQKLAVLVHFRELLLDDRTTTEMRDNIEYTICRLYALEYSEMLDCYVQGGVGRRNRPKTAEKVSQGQIDKERKKAVTSQNTRREKE